MQLTDEQRKAIEWAIGMASQHNIHNSPLRALLAAHSAGAQGQAVGEWVLVKRERLAEIKRYANAEFVNSYCGLNLYDERSLMENERIGERALSDIRDELRGIEEDEEDEKDRTAVHPQPMPQTDAARDQLRHFANAERFSRAVFADDSAFADWVISRSRHVLAEIERFDRSGE